MRFRVGSRQAAALELYFFDPAHDDDPDLFWFDGAVLEVPRENLREAWRALTDAANAADDHASGRGQPRLSAEDRAHYRADSLALTSLARRIGQAMDEKGLWNA